MPKDDPGYQACVDLKLSEGMTQEEAEAACLAEAAGEDPMPEVTMSNDARAEIARSKRIMSDPRRRVDLIPTR